MVRLDRETGKTTWSSWVINEYPLTESWGLCNAEGMQVEGKEPSTAALMLLGFEPHEPIALSTLDGVSVYPAVKEDRDR